MEEDADSLYEKAWAATEAYAENCKDAQFLGDNEVAHIQRDDMWKLVLQAIAAGPSAKDARKLALEALYSGMQEGFWFA